MSTTTQDQVVRDFIESMPSTDHLGIEILELGQGRALFQMRIAVAEVIKPGRRLAVARAEVFNDSVDGGRCLTGLFTAAGVAAKSS